MATAILRCGSIEEGSVLPPFLAPTPSCLAWSPRIDGLDARPRVLPSWTGMAGSPELRGDALKGILDVVRPL